MRTDCISSLLAAPVTDLAANTLTAIGATAALSPFAMAADTASSGFGMGHLAVGAAAVAVGMGIQSVRTRFASRAMTQFRTDHLTQETAATERRAAYEQKMETEYVECPVLEYVRPFSHNKIHKDIAESHIKEMERYGPLNEARRKSLANFEEARGLALAYVLPSLDGVNIPKEARLIALPGGEALILGQSIVFSPFYMMATDVSNSFYRRFNCDHRSPSGLDAPNQPVVNVGLYDVGVKSFIDWMNRQYPVDGMKWRLPLEAELVFAMLGPDNNTDDATPDIANIRASGYGITLDVEDDKYRNGYGLIHIRGNVRKLAGNCCNFYDGRPFSRDPAVNPPAVSCVVRGESWDSDVNERIGTRHRRAPEIRDDKGDYVYIIEDIIANTTRFGYRSDGGMSWAYNLSKPQIGIRLVLAREDSYNFM